MTAAKPSAKRRGKGTHRGADGVESESAKKGVYKGRTREERGETPQVWVPTAAEGAFAIAKAPTNSNISTEYPHISSVDPTPFSEGIYISSEDTAPRDALSINIAVDPPPDFPEPGTIKTQPKLSRNHGRDHTGKIIPHERNDVLAEQVARWVACGAGENEIAAFLGIRVGQLRKYYGQELDTGQFKNNMEVAGTILDLAKAGVPQMSIFWAKSRMGWRDSDKNDQNNAALLNIHIHT